MKKLPILLVALAVAVVAAGRAASAERPKCDEARVVALVDGVVNDNFEPVAKALRAMNQGCVRKAIASELKDTYSWNAVMVTKLLVDDTRADQDMFDGLVSVLVSQTLDGGQHDLVQALSQRIDAGPWIGPKLGALLDLKRAEGQARTIAIDLLGEAGENAFSQIGRLAVAASSDPDDETREHATIALTKILAHATKVGTIEVVRTKKVRK